MWAKKAAEGVVGDTIVVNENYSLKCGIISFVNRLGLTPNTALIVTGKKSAEGIVGDATVVNEN